jgi:hypothetical protein
MFAQRTDPELGRQYSCLFTALDIYKYRTRQYTYIIDKCQVCKYIKSIYYLTEGVYEY